MARLAGEDFGDRDALVLGLVGEHRPAHDVADRVDARHIGREMVVDDDLAALHRDAERLEAEPLRVGTPADRDQHDVGLERRAAPPAAGSIVALAPFAVFATAATLCDRWNLKPCFSSRRWNCLPTSPSMPGRMRSRNSTTVTSAPSRRHTEPSSSPITPAPTTISASGGLASASAPVEETICLLVDLDARQLRDVGAGGDDDRLGLVRRFGAVGAFDDDAARRGDPPLAMKPVDLVLLEQEGDAVDVGGDGVVLVLHHRGEIELGRRDDDAERAEPMRRLLEHFGGVAAAPSTGCSRC